MKEFLAERLLAEVLEWNTEEVAQERPILQALAQYKYDEYQQFSPGVRFIESLAIWLAQFETPEERKLAYDIVRDKLVFVSDAEIKHLVSIAYSQYIRPLLINQAASEMKVSRAQVNRITNSNLFKQLRRKTLFLGLSDGAHIGTFRRSNPRLSNEQIRPSYEMPKSRIQDLLIDLRKDLSQIDSNSRNLDNEGFSTLILLDDFSASGLSYFRETNKGQYKGKVAKLLQRLMENSDDISFAQLFEHGPLNIVILLYVATVAACSYLREAIEQFNIRSSHRHVNVQLMVLQEIPASTQIGSEYEALLKRYYDEGIVDRHYKVGNSDKPYLGFNECALPVVLNHNTPNNSVPLLWFDENRKYKGLFPRVSRHK